ncbi:MAG TPA: type II secretion system protein [Candidatus Doudnabacteria bacterium]|nr:type II secretion system protein [Candidatus Doudnabacteria bacterium]
MKLFLSHNNHRQSGFTLMEIIVATAIFVTVVTAILALFTYVMNINRRVQAVRQVAQGTRNFTEVLSREIRNGRIDYTQSGTCAANNYSSQSNQVLGIQSFDGKQTCLYLNAQTGMLYMQRITSPPSDPILINPVNFVVEPSTFRFIVKPATNPMISNSGYQPMVTIFAEFEIYKGQKDYQRISYQTTISNDIYDIPNRNN